jgi:hypothetical protein
MNRRRRLEQGWAEAKKRFVEYSRMPINTATGPTTIPGRSKGIVVVEIVVVEEVLALDEMLEAVVVNGGGDG